MRLDHLLSKEHLPPKGGKEPAPPECGGGVLEGGDTGEFEPATAGGPSTRGVSLDGTVLLVRLGRADSTLLGPEGTTGAADAAVVFRCQA